MKKHKLVDSVGGIAVQRAGFIKARQGLQFAACWWIATHELGHAPATVDEYVEWWGVRSRAQAFREQASFRECFPEFSTPTELADAVGVDFADLKRGRQDQIVRELFQVGFS